MNPTVPGPAPAANSLDKLVERAMVSHRYAGDALIEVLHVAQQSYGYLSHPVLQQIAHKLRLPPSKVLGVATFYHLFRFSPPAVHTAVVCLGTACYAAGGAELMQVVQQKCGTQRDSWSVEAGRCVGSCGLAPVVICDGRPLSRVRPAALIQYIEETSERGKP